MKKNNINYKDIMMLVFKSYVISKVYIIMQKNVYELKFEKEKNNFRIKCRFF